MRLPLRAWKNTWMSLGFVVRKSKARPKDLRGTRRSPEQLEVRLMMTVEDAGISFQAPALFVAPEAYAGQDVSQWATEDFQTAWPSLDPVDLGQQLAEGQFEPPLLSGSNGSSNHQVGPQLELPDTDLGSPEWPKTENLDHFAWPDHYETEVFTALYPVIGSSAADDYQSLSGVTPWLEEINAESRGAAQQLPTLTVNADGTLSVTT